MNTPSRTEPAFPCSTASFDAPGMSKREFMAAMAMQAMLPKLEPSDSLSKLYTVAVNIADSLLTELSK